MYWKPVNGECKPEVIRELVPKVECPPVRFHPISPCDVSTGRQTMEIIKYEFKDCKCHPLDRIVRDRQCSKWFTHFTSIMQVFTINYGLIIWAQLRLTNNTIN